MKIVGFLVLLPWLGGCQSLSRQIALAELEQVVMAAEQEAADDSAGRSHCRAKETRWRAPIQSQTQDIRIQRYRVVYYYLATYSMASGSPVAIIRNVTFLGIEDLSTGEKHRVQHE